MEKILETTAEKEWLQSNIDNLITQIKDIFDYINFGYFILLLALFGFLKRFGKSGIFSPDQDVMLLLTSGEEDILGSFNLNSTDDIEQSSVKPVRLSPIKCSTF
jgi:hypothetical protein